MLDYFLAALAVILITAVVTFFIIRKKNPATKENIINLSICTVLAMVCATLTPLLANLMVKELYFSIFLSVVISFIFMLAVAITAFLISKRLLEDKNKKTEATTEASVVILSNEMPQSGLLGLDLAAAVNEAAIISQVGGLEPEGDDASELAIFSKVEEFAEKEPKTENFSINELVERAMKCKREHHLPEAVSFYEQAIALITDADLLPWIVADLCSLYKKTNQKDKAHALLQTARCSLLNIQIKEDILQNL